MLREHARLVKKKVEAEEGKVQPNLITYIDVEPANCSDKETPPRAIRETQERECGPEELLADSLYGSDENVQKAAEKGVDIITPTMGKPKSKAPKQLRLAQRRVAEESDEFREKYRWRSGIEALNAKLKRMMKIGRLRVRGLARVRLAVTLKALGWNIFQAARA